MPTPYYSWGVKRRHLYDPIAETPLHLGTLDVDKLYHLQRPLYLGTLDLDKLYYLQRPPLAAPPADFQQPFRCCRCGHWLRDSKLLFQHASNPVFCQGLKADVGRCLRFERLSRSARAQLANIEQIWQLHGFPTGYPVRCPRCRHFFANHRFLAEHALMIFNLGRWAAIAEKVYFQELNCQIDKFKLLRMVPKERRTACLLEKVMCVLKLAGPFVGATCQPRFSLDVPVDIPGVEIACEHGSAVDHPE